MPLNQTKPNQTIKNIILKYVTLNLWMVWNIIIILFSKDFSVDVYLLNNI